MTQPAIVLLVRFATGLSDEELSRVVEERIDGFRALPGLMQKFYLRDTATREVAGLYLWESAEALDAFRESELRASIARAYRAAGEPRVEVYGVMRVLRG